MHPWGIFQWNLGAKMLSTKPNFEMFSSNGGNFFSQPHSVVNGSARYQFNSILQKSDGPICSENRHCSFNGAMHKQHQGVSLYKTFHRKIISGNLVLYLAHLLMAQLFYF